MYQTRSCTAQSTTYQTDSHKAQHTSIELSHFNLKKKNVITFILKVFVTAMT